MADPIKKNAIQKRLDLLKERYDAFCSDKEARLLRWVVDPDARQLFEAFFAFQEDELGDIPDLFLRFETPFEEQKAYGEALYAQLRQQYRDSKDTLADEGYDTSWRYPEPEKGDLDATAWVRACRSFHAHYEDAMDNLTLVLTPSAIADPIAWQSWLLGLLQHPVSEKIRYIVLEAADVPLLEKLATMQPVLIKTDHPDLDMPGAAEEMANAANTGDPGEVFRVHFVGMGNAAKKQDLPEAKRHAEAGLAIAKEHGWLDMQCVVHMTLASAYFGDADWEGALECYRQASAAAEQAEAEGHPAGAALRVQAKLSEGAALIQGEDYVQAAEVYEAAVPLAEAAGNVLMKIESWRMAAYCYECLKRPEEWWRCGMAALDAGEEMDEADRANSTLPFVGQRLLLLTAKRPYQGQEHIVHERMEALLGEEWEALLPEAMPS